MAQGYGMSLAFTYPSNVQHSKPSQVVIVALYLLLFNASLAVSKPYISSPPAGRTPELTCLHQSMSCTLSDCGRGSCPQLNLCCVLCTGRVDMAMYRGYGLWATEPAPLALTLLGGQGQLVAIATWVDEGKDGSESAARDTTLLESL